MNYTKVLKLIRSHKHFLISTHVNPDPDALCSELALAAWLKSIGKRVTVMNEEKVTERLSFLPYSRMVQSVGRKKSAVYDAAIIVDCGDLDRVGTVQNILDDRPVINIDHHITNDKFGDVNLLDVKASSTAEILYELLIRGKCKMTRTIAQLLYLGIMTDTGSFRYDNTSAQTHVIVAELMKKGVGAASMYRRVYETIPLNDLKSFAKVAGRFEHFHNRKAVCIVLHKRELARFSAQFDLRDALFRFFRSIEGAEVFVIVTEVGAGETRINLRSSGKVNVGAIAQNYGGGGHHNASGCKMSTNVSRARNTICRHVRKVLRESKL